MRGKFKVIIIIITVLMFFYIGKDVFMVSGATPGIGYANPTKRDVSAAGQWLDTIEQYGDKKIQDLYYNVSEYEEYIGIYYMKYTSIDEVPASILNSIGSEYTHSLTMLFESGMCSTMPTVPLDLLELFSDKDNGNAIFIKANYTQDELDKLCEYSNYYKFKSLDGFAKNSPSGAFLQKGGMELRDQYVVDGKTYSKQVAIIPYYVMCRRNPYDEDGKASYTAYKNVSTEDIEEDMNHIHEAYYNFKNNLNPYYDTTFGNYDTDFWGDASSWFGEAQGSYDTPEQVDKIIDTFSDMINVVGTTVIVVATIVLGIRYIIGTVENQTAAKEGLITLLVACIFFFGWTSISNLLYGGDKMDFIFTSSNDTSYTTMVGRLFSTFTYIAQFIVVGAIIYVGIKYIFAGASGRAELK